MRVDQGVTYGVRVFLSAPDPRNLPGVDSPHFVGTVDFFGHGHGDSAGGSHRAGDARPTPSSAVLSLTHVLRRLEEAKLYDPAKPLVILCQVAPASGVDAIGKVSFGTFKIEAVAARD